MGTMAGSQNPAWKSFSQAFLPFLLLSDGLNFGLGPWNLISPQYDPGHAGQAAHLPSWLRGGTCNKDY